MLNDKIYLTSINQSHHIDHNADQYEEAGHDGEGEEAFVFIQFLFVHFRANLG